MSDLDDDIFAELFGVDEGAVALAWEVASRCTCTSGDSKQPVWGCPNCTGTGVTYADATTINGIFRSQSRWLSFRREGELDRGEAQLTTPLDVRPGYTDRRVRDRFTTLAAVGDVDKGRVFYPAAVAVPFIFANRQRAWRVQLQSAELSELLVR
jgi:hypothetical protein